MIVRLTKALRNRWRGIPEYGPAGDLCGIDLVYWRPARGQNFGDYLSWIVVREMLARCVLPFADKAPDKRRRLLAIGSILHFARTGDTVWGSGVNGKAKSGEYRFDRLDVRAVRGPLTREFLADRGIASPDVYGDPALLLPKVFAERFRHDPDTAEGEVIVPNLHDIDLVSDEANVVSPLLRWDEIIHRIVGARSVIASSLHGLIVADAFGVPCRYVRLSETEPDLKYRDYALGVGREAFVPAHSIAEARDMGSMAVPTIDTERLIAAFPCDLWRGTAATSPTDRPRSRQSVER